MEGIVVLYRMDRASQSNSIRLCLVHFLITPLKCRLSLCTCWCWAPLSRGISGIWCFWALGISSAVPSYCCLWWPMNLPRKLGVRQPRASLVPWQGSDSPLGTGHVEETRCDSFVFRLGGLLWSCHERPPPVPRGAKPGLVFLLHRAVCGGGIRSTAGAAAAEFAELEAENGDVRRLFWLIRPCFLWFLSSNFQVC